LRFSLSGDAAGSAETAESGRLVKFLHFLHFLHPIGPGSPTIFGAILGYLMGQLAAALKTKAARAS
jgi:hypothetical protein